MAPSPLLLLLLATALAASPALTRAQAAPPGSPPPPVADFRDMELDFETEDLQRRPFAAANFTLSFGAGGERTPFGSVVGQAVVQRPALATLPLEGGSQTLVTLEACAINQPHTHPRATELAFVTKGELFFGFLEENFNARTQSGGRFLSNPIPAGSTFVIPQGLVHFALNRGCEQAQFLATFPTRDPGTQTVLRSLFGPQVPDDVLRASTGLSDLELQRIREKVAANLNPSADIECLKKCAAPAPQ